MNSFYKLIASIIKEADETTSSHSSFRLVDPNAVGDNPVRELVLDVVSLGDESNNSIVSLAWDGGNKVLEKTASSEECQHMAQLISSDLAQAVKLTSEDKYDEAKNVITNVLKTYAETTDTPIPTNLPPVTTTQASNEFDGLWKVAKVVMRNTFQKIEFDSNEDLLKYQQEMSAKQPGAKDQDSIPLWDVNKGKPEEQSTELAPPSVSYQDLEKEKELEQKNITKRIENEVKEQIESSLEQKQATLFTDKDKQLVEALRGVGRSWEEVRDFMTKSLKYEKEDVAAYLDQFRGSEKGEEINVVKEKSLPTIPKPPENLVSPETHDQLLKDLDKSPVEEKKIESPVKEPKFTPKEIMEIPEEEEVEEKESSIERADNAEIRRVASQDKTALNPLQVAPQIEEQPTAETSNQDTVPMGMGTDHPTPKPEDWVIVKSDLKGELSSFRAKFVSEETHNDGSKWGIVDRDGELLTVEMHRIAKESEGAQTTEPVSAPELAQPKEDEIAITPKQSDLYSSLKESKHEHDYQKGKSNSVLTCPCGAFKYTEEYLKKNPPIVEQKESSLKKKAEFVFGPEDVGVYGDGAAGHAHIRAKLAELISPWSPDLAKELGGEMSDDASEEQDALDLLQSHTEEGLYWQFFDGDLGLWAEGELEASKKASLESIKAEVKKLEAQLKKAESEKCQCGHAWGLHGYHAGDNDRCYNSDCKCKGYKEINKVSFKFIKKGLEKHADDSAFEGNGWCRVWVQEDEIAVDAKYPEVLKIADESARIKALKEIAREIAHESLRLADSAGSKVGVQSWFEVLKPSDHDRIDWVALANPQQEAVESSLKQSNVMDTKCEECGEPLGPEAFLSKWPVCGDCIRKRHKKVTGTEKQAADPVEPKTEYKELKKSPDFVDPKSAVPVSPDMEQTLIKMESLQAKLSVLDQAKEKIKMSMEQELQKIDVGGERASLQKELQDSYEKLGILIDATESKVVNWGEKLYTLQHQEKEVVPQPSTKELLAKIYAKFEGAERFVDSVLNGFKALAKKVQTKRLVQWPKRSSLEPVQKEASVMDDFNQLNEEMLKALQALS